MKKLTLLIALCLTLFAGVTQASLKLLVIYQLRKEIHQYDVSTGLHEGIWGNADRILFSSGGPQSFAISEARVFVSTSGDQVLQFTYAGTFEKTIATPNFGSGATDDIAINPAGIIYASEPKDAIYRYDQAGTNLGAIPGSEFNSLHSDGIGSTSGLTFDSFGQLFAAISDNQNAEDRIVYFSNNNDFLGTFGEAHNDKTPLLKAPSDLVFDSLGNLLVADGQAGILKFSSEGKYLTQFAENGFISLAVDPMDNIYAGTKTRVFKFEKEGELLETVISSAETENFVDLAILDISGTSTEAPVADAGSDQTVIDSDGDGREDVMLNASASMDADGTIESYFWSWIDDDPQNASGVSPTVSFPLGTITVTLTVSDNSGRTDTDSIVIIVKSPPTSEDMDEMDDAWELANFGNLDRDGSGDFDQDGASDLTEFKLGSNPILADMQENQLFIDANTDGFPDAFFSYYDLDAYEIEPNEDYDGDGCLNIDEYWWGTNPLVIDEALRSISINTDLDLLSIPSVAGISYEIQSSENLHGFTAAARHEGTGEILEIPFQVSNHIRFWRVRPIHLDFDGDGISNFEERLLGTDYLASDDTDNDGIADHWELAQFGELSHDKFHDGDSDSILLYDEWRYGLSPHVDDHARTKQEYSYDFDRLISVGRSITFSFDKSGNLVFVK